MQKTININGRLMDLTAPRVMAIINVTTDSLARHCTNITEAEILRWAAEALSEGADILDIGGCSTRPGSTAPSEEEEWRRVRLATSAIRREWPEAILSVDTYRASVARRAVEEQGVSVINDISGGQFDDKMFEVVAGMHVPYILTHTRALPETMQQHTDYSDLMSEVLGYLQERVDTLHRMGVADIILDPGFGFAKTTEQNYELLRKLEYLKVLGLPILAGLSRKSMITRPLDISPDEALQGTIALQMLALCNGANILRVHDVKEAKQLITLYNHYAV
ncbi:MAG: dihydropteroate synthase [Paludibacteraceae bacterium]|nr:dihydropteroate synthase [Paludibacteraceae bacterium]